MAPTRQAFLYEASTTGSLLILAFALFVPYGGASITAGESADAAASAHNPQALVRQVIHNELRDDADDMTHWRFRKTDDKGGTSKTWDVVETKSGEVQCLIAMDGHSLSKQQQIAEEARIQKFLASPEEQQKRKQSSSNDFKKEQDLMRMLPNALTYRYVGEERGMIHLTFTPNPSFHASTREAEVFHHMAGDMWIKKSNMRLAELRGHLISRVEFGYGMLGHLNKGGTFNVKQGEVAKDHWDLTLLQTDITGKALFFKTITVKEKMTESDYHRVPDDLTLRQAADLLRHNDTQSALSATPSPSDLRKSN